MTENKKLFVAIAFSDKSTDVDDVGSAIRELQRAGFEVYYSRDDDADRLEAHIGIGIVRDPEVVLNALVDEVQEIIDKHGGTCIEWGPVTPDHELFSPPAQQAS